jgi:IS5 family transposase
MGQGFGKDKLEQRQAKLEEKKDLLVRLGEMIEWEAFRASLERVDQKPRKSKAGRKRHDVILMFKLLILQQLYNISDDELEYQVNDRLSFMRFLGLDIGDTVPDATSVWLFRKQLRELGLIESLFEQFDGYLRNHGYQAKGGQIVDATLIPVPKQHNRKEDTEQLEQGEIPTGWTEHPKRFEQRDLDARWTKKHGKSYFGYKSHISIDGEHGFIRRYAVTDASVHDSQVLGQLLDDESESDAVWADRAYRSETIEAVLELLQFESHIHERAYRNHSLTEQQQTDNRERSSIRAKVEHVFGNWMMTMVGKLVHSIGLDAVGAILGLKHLTYNLSDSCIIKLKSQPKVGKNAEIVADVGSDAQMYCLWR